MCESLPGLLLEHKLTEIETLRWKRQITPAQRSVHYSLQPINAPAGCHPSTILQLFLIIAAFFTSPCHSAHKRAVMVFIAAPQNVFIKRGRRMFLLRKLNLKVCTQKKIVNEPNANTKNGVVSHRTSSPSLSCRPCGELAKCKSTWAKLLV